MSKYIFKKINDEPFYDPNQKEIGFAPKNNKYNKIHTKVHNFGLTREQEDALRHIVVKEGIGYNDIINCPIFKRLNDEDKNEILKKFGKRKDTPNNDVLYYYSKALDKEFPNKNNLPDSFEDGVILVINKQSLIPITMYGGRANLGNNLKRIYVYIKGERNDVDYIKNAPNNANTFTLEEPYGIGTVLTSYHNPLMSKIIKKGKKDCPSLEKINYKFETLKQLINYDKSGKKILPGCNQEESDEIRRFIKKWIEENGNALHYESFREPVQKWQV